MAIRITGMYSGLDTESIISELASAQSVKKNKLVKAQTKLSWKQDAWKALNTKIYSFYTNILDNMRFEGSYMRKSTKVSHPNAVSIVTSADAPNSVQTLKIGQLAKQGYLTGGKLAPATDKNGNEVKVSATTKLKDMGFSGEGSFRVKVNGRSTDITLKEDMKISDVVNQLNAAGLSASFDAKNQRFYVNAKNSGATADFTITSNDAGGKDILGKLGLVAAYDKNSNEYKEYQLWAGYGDPANEDAFKKAKEAEIAKLIAAKKASTDSLLKANEEYQKRLDALFKDNDENSKYQIDYDENDKKKVNDQANALYEELYGKPKLDADGKPELDADGNPVMEKYGLDKTLEDAKKTLKDAQDKLAELKKNNTATEADIELAEKAVTEASEKVTDAQKAFNEKNAHYSYVKGVANIQNAIEANKETIADNRSYYEVDPSTGEPVLGDDKNLKATQKAKDEIAGYFKDKIEMAEKYLEDAANYETLSDAEKEALGLATKIDGRDATINLNGVEYTSSKNTFEINGMTITVQQEISEEITLTTAEDTDEIFNMIKNFFTEYNKLINEMDGLYNADSSKGYEPLLSEEKQGLADSEIEEWEKKIKDSLLRRDSTLRNVTDAMKNALMQGATVNGKTMYLSDFGINTLGYFNAADNEKGAYHIDGDKDDPAVANNDDKLRAMIASDPATVQKFFAGLSKNLYDTLTDKMKAVKDTSSAFTVYNDKTMEKEYKDYTDRIKKEETKLNALIDNWYKKFSAMETAMAKLQSKNNAVSGMLGG